ncbi:CDP-alcohol phosphatidyltransferase family protein [Promethearchaeum syntrophicum]|uniref:CDP-alcohol phosphatidyltransferase family protein n=1 Tax=Promethearchaeum syntrophicum TaxID=2594042 RepID=A0A5B9D9N4_9ARCH|nr:CDP-alcohol phosphatidyltransferase family protein [Candidatus Prometheoarchaeum syntrophicum]QEE15803.1 CDP-alcohol phosphatidyltransferase [Candidatus Prometheoarchaeum syntrophicum]
MALTVQLNESLIGISVDYKKTTKKVSEVINSVLYRPLGFPLVLLGKKLKLTPNFFTTLSLITMLISAYFYSQSMIYWAAILLFVKQTLDCVDGSLARLTNQFSKFGGQYDFYADIIGFILMTLSMAFSMAQLENNSIYYLFYILMAISVAIGELMFEKAKSQYLNALSGKKEAVEKLSKKSSSKLIVLLKKVLNKPENLFKYLTKFPDISSPMYSSIDRHYLSKIEKEQVFEKYFSPLINLWSFIGGAASLTTLVILTLFDLVNLIYIILPISILTLIVLISQIQRLVAKKFEWNYQV